LTIIGDPTTGISKKITLSQMASLFTGTVEEYANLASFPLVGAADTIYIALDTNVLYRWDTGLTSYVELSPNIINSLVFNDANGFDGTISLVGSVATLTITTALTTGSVGFIGASGALLQDNANFFWDDTNNRLGIGTNAPTTAIDAFGSSIITRVNGTSTNNAFIGFASAGTNKWSVGNVQSDHRFRIYSEANTSELVSVLQTGEFGIGIANPTTKLHIDGGASALIANLDANVSVAKSISFRSDNSNRINIEVSGTESGSNAGANFFIRRYSDAGALIDTPLTITRSTGAITLATALSGTTATFSGNVLIGTSSNITGVLQVKSSGTGTNTNALLVYDNSSNGNAFVVSNATGESRLSASYAGTGINSNMTFYTTNSVGTSTEKMRIVSDSAPTVLIGTTSTTGAIVVDANRANLVLGAGTSSKIAFNNGSTTQTGYIYNSATETSLGYAGTFNIQQVGGSNVLTVNSNGTLIQQGTGVSPVSLQLTSVNPNCDITLQSTGSSNVVRLRNNTDDFQIHTNGSERMRITSGGNVGINTSTPASRLSLGGALLSPTNAPLNYTPSTTRQGFFNSYYANNEGLYPQYLDIVAFGEPDGTNGGGIIRFLTNPVTSGSASVERMRITSGGYLKASNNGTYINGATSTFHSLEQSGTTDVALYAYNGYVGNGNVILARGYSNNTSGSLFLGYSSILGDYTIRIFSNGNIQNTNNSYGSLSDIKLKENIIDTSSKLEDLLKVRIVNYNLIGHETKQIGVIAQELEKIFPSMIDEIIDTDEMGNDLGTTTKSVKYSVFVPMLIKAIQEQQAQIEELKAK
jgi:hypothetical protein